MGKKRRPKKAPKPRHVWQINPKPRVRENKKLYVRAKERKTSRKLLKNINWFGER